MQSPQSPSPPRARFRKYLPLLGFALLFWVLSRLDRQALAGAFARIEARALLEAALLFAMNFVLKAFRWQRMLIAQKLVLPTRVAVAAFFNGQFYGQVTLGRVGELYRAEALTERGVPLGTALSSSLYDRLLDLVLVVLVACVLSAQLAANVQVAAWSGVLLFALIAFAVGVARGRLLGTFSPFVRLRAVLAARQGTSGPVGLISSMIAGLGPLLRPWFAIEATLWTLISWFFYFASLWRLAVGMGVVVTPVLLVAGAALGALSALLPVTVSGIGAREVIFMHMLAIEHVPEESAVALSLLHLSMMTFVSIALGLCGMLARHRQQRAPVEPLSSS